MRHRFDQACAEHPRLRPDRRRAASSAKAFGSDVIVENDVNVGAIGERWLGRAEGIDTFGYIALGTGLGMGIVSDGEIIRGAHGGAGEIANLPLGGDPFDPANRLHGTLEAAVGSAGIIAPLRRGRR